MRVSLMTNSLFFKARRERFSFFVRRAGGGRDTLKRTYICTPLFFRTIIQTQNPRTPIESTNASSCVNISAPFRVCKNRDRFFSVAFFGLYGGVGVLGFVQIPTFICSSFLSVWPHGVGLGGHSQTFSAIDLCRRNDAESVKLIPRISKRDAFRSAKKERENAEMGTIAIASPKSQSVN